MAYFFALARTARISGAQISARDTRKKQGITCPPFSFFKKIHCKYKLDRYLNNLHCFREQYLARLCQSSSFFVLVSTARISRASLALKLDLVCSEKLGVVCPIFPF